MMNIDKKQLKILSMEFRTIANRLINSNNHTAMILLKKFLTFIDENEVISEFVQGYVNPSDFEAVESGICFSSMGDTKQEEISYTYQYLKYAISSFDDFYHDMAWGYAKDTNDAVKEFCNRIILPFVNYIEGYLTEIGIKMGYDEDMKYMINVSGGVAQVNVAHDNATVNANQNNGIDGVELEKLILSLVGSMPADMSEEDKEQVSESIEIIRSEMQNVQPRRGLLKSVCSGLQAIKSSAEFAAAVVSLYQFVLPLIG